MTQSFHPAGSQQPGGAGGLGAVILLGPPGAGKGTQAVEMARRWGVPVVSTGNMIRAVAGSASIAGARARSIMERGELMPDDWMNELVAERLKQPDCGRGFLLDGYPRTRAQADALEALLAGRAARVRVISFRIAADEVVRRIGGRRLCPQCGAVYHLTWQPPREPGLCDRDRTPLITRPDDREQVVRERLRLYERQTQPLLEFFRDRGHRVHELDAARPPREVSDELTRSVEAA